MQMTGFNSSQLNGRHAGCIRTRKLRNDIAQRLIALLCCITRCQCSNARRQIIMRHVKNGHKVASDDIIRPVE